MGILKLMLDVIRPGHPELKAQLALITEDQARLVRSLHLLEQPATRSVVTATDSAAEFT